MYKDQMKMFIECHVPIKACNFKCDYCYVTQNKWWASEKPDFSLCLEKIEKALAVSRIGGIAMINLCATGETLLYPEMVDVIHKMLAAGHYVMVVTNGTLTERFKRCCEFSEDERSRLFFKFSFHYLELKKKGLMDCYFSNVRLVHENGISFTVEITPDDEYIPYIDEIKTVCMKELGVLCHVTVPRDERLPGFPLMTKLKREEFVKTWSQFDSELFRFKESIFEVKRHEYCYAGKWGFVFDLGTGDYSQCYKGRYLGNLYKDVDEPLNLYAVGCQCQEGHCFNGHAFLGFGLIPELTTSDYADMRNRVLPNGDRWLSPRMEEFMRRRLKEDNTEDDFAEKLKSNVKSIQVKRTVKTVLKQILSEKKD